MAGLDLLFPSPRIFLIMRARGGKEQISSPWSEFLHVKEIQNAGSQAKYVRT